MQRCCLLLFLLDIKGNVEKNMDLSGGKKTNKKKGKIFCFIFPLEKVPMCAGH